MKYLVYCPCGHSLDTHGSEGCDGERGYPCPCRLEQLDALNAAIDRVRSDAGGWRGDGSVAEIA